MKVAVVTGGGRGLGRAFALALAADHAIAVMARSAGELDETVALVHAAGGRARAYVADVTDHAAIERAFASIERELGPIDLLVNNAGVVAPLGPFADGEVGDWWRAMEVNLLGPVICSQRVLPGMRARRRGRIVNVASGGGAIMRPYFSAYITSKTAVIRFSECLAAEVASIGIAVFAMGPGTVRTAMSEYSLNSPEGKKWLPWFKDIFDQGRDLPPERPAALLCALASGRFDALSGRFVQPSDDLDRLLDCVGEISSQALYTLQVPKL
ncbi:MAG: SDR family oxidoreductase [Alphaproteobacteria bacterium]|nr:SDR family oxidoreductase [Alphaproteobacteria bacterium]MBV8412650.1 SDR family oxidoreductase [Alphaproteobacteria bacterium]